MNKKIKNISQKYSCPTKEVHAPFLLYSRSDDNFCPSDAESPDPSRTNRPDKMSVDEKVSKSDRG